MRIANCKSKRNAFTICCLIISVAVLTTSGCCYDNKYCPIVLENSANGEQYIITTTRDSHDIFESRVIYHNRVIYAINGKVQEAVISQNGKYIVIVYKPMEQQASYLSDFDEMVIVNTDNMQVIRPQKLYSEQVLKLQGQNKELHIQKPQLIELAIDNSGKALILFWSYDGRVFISQWNVLAKRPEPETLIFDSSKQLEPIGTIYSDIRILGHSQKVVFETEFVAKDTRIALPSAYYSEWDMKTGSLRKIR